MRLEELKELKGTKVNNELLEKVEESENVESCEYIGLEHGHGGDYLYDIKLIDGTEFSITNDDK